jgi:16S rRNA (guanine966-N2)-methyltransferase
VRRHRSGPPGVVRILAGRWKGRAVDVPPAARPTAGRARQALFDVLRDRVAGARVLDLYAGSGALGLEALSRGAAACVFVEPDDESLRRTLKRLCLGRSEARPLRSTAARAARSLAQEGETFDLIFADPPYGSRPSTLIPPGLGGLLSGDGLLVVQADRGVEVPVPEGLTSRGQRGYGRNVFHLFGMH